MWDSLSFRLTATISPSVWLFAAVALFAAAPQAVAIPATDGAIDVELVESVIIQDRSFVSVACRGPSTIGCTVFTNMRIACSCSFEESQWRIRWFIRGNATMLVTPGSIKHEAEHVKDLRARLESFASQVENARFEKETECERAIDRALEVFPSALHDVVRKNVLQVDRKALEPSQVVAVHH